MVLKIVQVFITTAIAYIMAFSAGYLYKLCDDNFDDKLVATLYSVFIFLIIFFVSLARVIWK